MRKTRHNSSTYASAPASSSYLAELGHLGLGSTSSWPSCHTSLQLGYHHLLLPSQAGPAIINKQLATTLPVCWPSWLLQMSLPPHLITHAMLGHPVIGQSALLQQTHSSVSPWATQAARRSAMARTQQSTSAQLLSRLQPQQANCSQQTDSYIQAPI